MSAADDIHGQPGARAATQRSRLDTVERLTSVDHPDRSSSFPTRPRQVAYLRVDHTHDPSDDLRARLPLVALDELGKEVARFRSLADLAWYLTPNATATLPLSIVTQARSLRHRSGQAECGQQLTLGYPEGGL